MSAKSSVERTQLVSIICRTLGRPELQQALQSIDAQDYPNIEIVLVDAAGDNSLNLAAAGERPLNLVNTGSRLSRSQAANAGLEAAKGKYIQFLDDDDWIGSNHISQLVKVLNDNHDIAAAYSSTQKTNAAGVPLNHVFREDFDPILLMRDNYIPIHAILFDSALLKHGCRFDEAFDIYEDWDFWLQLSQYTTFQHIDSITAYYREGGDSETAVEDVHLRYQPDNHLGKGRAAIFKKWLPQWSGEALNTLIGHLDQSDLLCEKDARIHSERSKNEKLQHAIYEKIMQINTLNLQLEQHIQHANELEQQLNTIYNSMGWKLMGPARRITRALLGPTAAIKPNDKKEAIAESSNLLEAEQDSQKTKAQQQAKEELDNSAKAALEDFLASKKELRLPDTNSPRISIALVFYQQAHLSYLCLQSLLKFADIDYELIIVDNNSTDKTTQLLDRIVNAKIIRNTENLGFVKAVNQAGEAASAEYILLLNNDALIEKNTLSNALQIIDEDKTIGAVGAKIKLLDGSMQEAGSIIWSDGSCLGYGRGKSPDDYQFMFQRDVDYCSGAFLLFRRSSFNELNGFDLDYAPAYYEESDFCIRLKKQGLRIVYVPSSQITHYEFASTGGMGNARKLQIEHQKILCEKHADFLATRFTNDCNNILHARTHSDSPNILVIDDRVPHPSLGAGYPRCSNLLSELSKMDFNISLYPLQFPEEDWDDVYQTLPHTIEVILNSGREKLRSFLEERKNYYQYVIVSRIHNMELVNHCLNMNPDILGETKIIYDAEAVSAPREILHRELLGETISAEDQKLLISKEVEQSKPADKIVAVSRNEADIFKQYGYDNTVVLGHTLASKPSSNGFAQRNGFLFVGALRDEGSPNLDSLHWFLINVFPILEQALPNIELYIVGDNSAASLAAINKKNVHFTGRLDSVEEMYNRCRVFIAPTRFAAGIPHKVHEAAAQGLPSVTTSLLAKQLSWKNEQELLVADTVEEYAAQCLKLYQDEKLWKDIRDAGLTAVAKDCSQETFRKNLAGLFT